MTCATGSASRRANELRVKIVQGVCEEFSEHPQGKDAPLSGVVARLSGTMQGPFKSGIDGKTVIQLPPNVKTGLTVTIEVLRGHETLDVKWPPGGNLVMPELNSDKFAILVVQPKGTTSALCSVEFQSQLSYDALASSPLQSTTSPIEGSVPLTPEELSHLAQQFEKPSVDRFPIGLLALEISDWQRAADAFESSLKYRIAEYHNNQGSEDSVADAAYLLGYSHFQLKHFSAAAQAFKESDSHRKNMPLTLASYAISLEQARGGPQEIYNAYASALTVMPADGAANRASKARLLHSLGGYLNNQQNYREAEKKLQEAIALLEGLPNQEIELADDYLELANTRPPNAQDAERYLGLAINLLQTHPEKLAIARYRLAAFLTDYYGKSRSAEAEKLFRSSCPMLRDEDDNLNQAACKADYADLLRREGHCPNVMQELQSLFAHLDEIATNPNPAGRDIANKVRFILQECKTRNPPSP